METRIIYSPEILDGSCHSSVAAVLEQYKKKGVILAGGQDDSVFLCTNQLARTTLDFTCISQEDYSSNLEKLFCIPYDTFIMSMKCGVILDFGKATLPSLRGVVGDIAYFVGLTEKDLQGNRWAWGLKQPHLFLDILLRLPVTGEPRNSLEWIVSEAEEALYEPGAKARRTLPDFKSIFIFENVIIDFMEKAGDREKALYYPLYIWWTICSIIPTRPLELIVTPFDCLSRDGAGRYTLRLRKSAIKGSNKRVGYTLDEDFFELKVPVTEKEASVILGYQAILEHHGLKPPHLGTLLSPQLHCLSTGVKPGRDSYYTYALFTSTLKMFSTEIVEGRYGYRVYYGHGNPPALPEEKWTSYIRPGDLRHLSMVNMAAEGIPVATLMLFGGHRTPKQTAHYAGNYRQYEDSMTHRAYESMEPGLAALTPLVLDPPSIKEGDPFVELDDGRCYSPQMVRGDACDCVTHVGSNVELGWCAACPYFRNSNPTLTLTDCTAYIRSAEESWKLLKETIDHYRRDYLGAEEDLLRKVLGLQTDENVLKRVLRRFMEEGLHGKDGQDAKV